MLTPLPPHWDMISTHFPEKRELNNFDTLFVRAHRRAPLQKTKYSVLFNLWSLVCFGLHTTCHSESNKTHTQPIALNPFFKWKTTGRGSLLGDRQLNRE